MAHSPMKWRIVETTGSPEHEPSLWQSDAGRYRFVVGMILSTGEGETDVREYWSGLLSAQGSDYAEVDSIRIHPSFAEAQRACAERLVVLIDELKAALCAT